MMFAPSTVMAMGIITYGRAAVRRPAHDARARGPSIASTAIARARSVVLCFMIDESTIGASWLSTMAFMSSAPLTHTSACAPMRATASCTPPNSAMGTLNCLRARAYAPTEGTSPRAAATAAAGSETPRPSASASTNMCQPWPHLASPPRIADIGIHTSSPCTVPFMNAAASGMWRGPMRRPGGRARAGDREALARAGRVEQPSGSFRSKPMPTMPATGAA